MNILMKFLHLIPFVHFYDQWSSPEACRGYAGDERQQRFCVICNKKQYRTVNNYTLLDK
jgi:hypothetical protein